jgi:outer membrane protein assembly factor BamB
MALGFERQTSVGSIFSTPLVVGGVVYIGSADGRLYALD